MSPFLTSACSTGQGLAGYEGYVSLRPYRTTTTMICVTSSRRTVVLVAFDGMQLLDIVGPAEMFDAATQLVGDQRGYQLVIATSDGSPVRGSGAMKLVPDTALDQVRPGRVDTMIVGGGMNFERAIGDQRLAAGLHRLSGGTQRTCSVCTGAF